jgi:hypothetical protein
LVLATSGRLWFERNQTDLLLVKLVIGLPVFLRRTNAEIAKSIGLASFDQAQSALMLFGQN